MGCIIAISNQKGGVGKTTTTVNLSASIAKAGKKVLIIDSDPQGNATTGLGVDKLELSTGLYDFMLGSEPIDTASVKTEMPGLFIMGATKELVGAEVEMYLEDDREFLLKNSLDKIKDLYDFIIIDCPPTVSMFTYSAYIASDGYIVPVRPDPLSTIGLPLLERFTDDCKNNFGKTIKQIGIIFTMVGKTKLERDQMKKMSSSGQRNIFANFVSYSSVIAKTVEETKPVFNSTQRWASKYGEQLKLITEEFLAIVEEVRSDKQ